MKRFFVIVLDSFGIGEMPDAAALRPQDAGANTCKHIFTSNPDWRLPSLEKLGLGNALGCELPNLRFAADATYGRATLGHYGADTFYGHQEIVGSRPQQPRCEMLQSYLLMLQDTLRDAGYYVRRYGEGISCLIINEAVIIGDNLECDAGQAINVTGALDRISFQQVRQIGQIVRQIVKVPRVIALGGQGLGLKNLLAAVEKREEAYIGVNCPKSGVYQHGYQVVHLGYGIKPEEQVATILQRAGISVALLGKAADIIEAKGAIRRPGVDTAMILTWLLQYIQKGEGGPQFVVANVQETDLAGHAEDVERYRQVLCTADDYIGQMQAALKPGDVLIVMADHGNDPTIGHGHHTREFVPLLVSGPGIKPGYIGQRNTMADVAATAAEYFGVASPGYGESFLNLL